MGEGVMERSRQQLVDLDSGRVTDVVVPEMTGTCAEVIELRA
ncbi:hypothetical protein [Geminicoccus flavidas]|nr:hypothetical protein [Geminicoccus flavidas]